MKFTWEFWKSQLCRCSINMREYSFERKCSSAGCRIFPRYFRRKCAKYFSKLLFCWIFKNRRTSIYVHSASTVSPKLNDLVDCKSPEKRTKVVRPSQRLCTCVYKTRKKNRLYSVRVTSKTVGKDTVNFWIQRERRSLLLFCLHFLFFSSFPLFFSSTNVCARWVLSVIYGYKVKGEELAS